MTIGDKYDLLVEKNLPNRLSIIRFGLLPAVRNGYPCTATKVKNWAKIKFPLPNLSVKFSGEIFKFEEIIQEGELYIDACKSDILYQKLEKRTLPLFEWSEQNSQETIYHAK